MVYRKAFARLLSVERFNPIAVEEYALRSLVGRIVVVTSDQPGAINPSMCHILGLSGTWGDQRVYRILHD
jgi:hypothetical protein